MDEAAISAYIVNTFAGVEVATVDGTSFFFTDPEHKFPFATMVTNNAYDDGSDLDRPGVYRLNIGVGKATFQRIFGADGADGRYDLTALDTLMPHPDYGRMYWVCMLNPSAERFAAEVQPLLAEAYALSIVRYGRGAAQTGGSAASQQ